jgi:hypothetical protein
MARGRPPIDEAIRKSEQLSIRISASLREKLEASSKQTERSLSQEIEARLRLSFEENQIRIDEFCGQENYWLFRIIANQIRTLEKVTYIGEHRLWWDDPYLFKQVKILINTILDYLKPKGRAVTPRHHAELDVGNRTIIFAEPFGQRLGEHIIAGTELMRMNPDPPNDVRIGGMTLNQLWAAGWLFKKALKKSPLAKKLSEARRRTQ